MGEEKDWEKALKKALNDVLKDLNKGIYLREENIQAMIYHYLRERLPKKYTVFNEFKYYWKHRKDGCDFDLAILQDWNSEKDNEICSADGKKKYRYGKVVGVIELKLSGSLNRIWARGSVGCNYVDKRIQQKDLKKFIRLKQHKSQLTNLERAYLCLFEGEHKSYFEDNELPDKTKILSYVKKNGKWSLFKSKK